LQDKLFQILWLEQVFKEILYFINYNELSKFETPIQADGSIFEVSFFLAGSGSV
jgi:hypothetical protein